MLYSQNHRYRMAFLPLLIGSSLIIKLTLFLLFFHGDYSQITQPDSGGYLSPAYTLLSQGSFAYMFERTPGYPLFIATLTWLFGKQLSVIIIAQIILSSLLPIQGFFIARRLFGQNVAFLSSLLIAVSLLYFSYNIMILSETLFALLISTTFLIGAYLFSGAKHPLWLTFLLGLTLALSTLTRPISYYLIIPITFGTLWYFRQSSWKYLSFVFLLLVLPSLILVGGWQVRNKLQVNTYSYSDISTYNLYWHYAGDILQKTQHLDEQSVHDLLENKIKQQGPMAVAGRQDFMHKTAIAIIRQHPKALFLQMLTGFPKLMLGPDPSWALLFSTTTNWHGAASAKKELLHLHFNNILTHYNPGVVFIIVLSLCASAILLFYHVCLLIGLFHLREATPKKHIMAHCFLLGCMLYFIVVSSSSISYGRFRVPFELLLNVYTSFGIICIMSWLKQRVRQRGLLHQPQSETS